MSNPSEQIEGFEDHLTSESVDVYHQIDSLPKSQFMDLNHQRVQSAGRRLLKEALADSSENDQSLDSLWTTFRDFVRAHEYSEAIAKKVKSIEKDLVQVVREEYAREIRAEAVAHVTREIKATVSQELRATLSRELAPEIESEVRARLEAEFRPSLQSRMVAALRDDLTPKVREEVRTKLLEDPALRSEVMQELKRRILGI